MTDTRNPNRRIDFSEAGEGCYLLLRNSGTRQLQTFFGEEWWATVERSCQFYHVENIEKMLSVMVWKDDKKVENMNLDKVDDTITMQEISTRILDTFSLAMTGRKFLEQQKWVIEEQKRLRSEPEEAENPPMSLETSSTVSAAEPSAPA